MLNTLKNIIKLAIAAFLLLSAVFISGGLYERNKDVAEALHNKAGYYQAETGIFKFSPAPIELATPSLEQLSQALPMPSRKPNNQTTKRN
jgi:hypothetical protein